MKDKMSKVKVAEVRTNPKTGIVQIKMNKGPNHILEGKEAVQFEQKRNFYINNHNSHSVSSLLAANDYFEGNL